MGFKSASAVMLAAAFCACRMGGAADAEPESVTFRGPGEAYYGGGEAVGTLTGRVGKELPDRLRPDPCLERVSALLAPHVRSGCRLWPSWMEEAAFYRAGCQDAGADFLVTCSGGPSPGSFIETVRAEAPERAWATHFGAAEADAGWFAKTWVLAMAERSLRLTAPFPRSVEPGASHPLSFRLAGGFAKPRVYLMSPEGGTRVLDVAAGEAAKEFTAYFSAAGPGEYWLEVMASGREGPRVGALFPVSVGTRPASTVRRPPRSRPDPASDAEVEPALLAMLNSERRSRGLSPVSPDPALAAIARAHSEAMLRRGRLAHVDPDGKGPGERAAEAGYAARVLGEVLASAVTVEGAHAALMNSPAHRSAMLDPRFTAAGVGAAVQRSGGKRIYWVSEELAVPQRLLPTAEVERRLSERIARHRERFVLHALARDPRLDAAARGLVADILSYPSGQEDAIFDQGFAPALRRAGWTAPAGASLQIVMDPDELTLPAAAGSRETLAFGAAAGFRRVDGPVGNYVVLLITSTGGRR